MNTSRNLLLSAAITVMGITACNYTVGNAGLSAKGEAVSATATKNQNSVNLRTSTLIAVNADCLPLHVRRHALQQEQLAACGSIAAHPYKSGKGTGQLTWCKNGSPTYVCDYAFPNGDACAVTFTPMGAYWLCSYAGGK